MSASCLAATAGSIAVIFYQKLNAEKIKIPKKSWIQLIILVSLIGIGTYGGIYDKYQLKKCKVISWGKIINIDKRKKRGHYVHYIYEYEGEEYKSSETLRSKSDLAELNIGDSIRIYRSCNDNNVTRYISKNENE